MKNWLNTRTIALVFWIVLSIVMIVTMPNLNTLLREKGQIEIPESAQSELAAKLLNEMNENGKETYDVIAVFTSGNEEALTKTQKDDIEAVIAKLKDNQASLGITEILAHTDSEEIEKQLAARDGTTILTRIAVDQNQGTIEEVANELRKITEIDSVKRYFTGTDLVLDDFTKSTEEGIKKTEIIAVIFILIVLILVFRSPIVPVISLVTVGVSYLVSLSIVTQLVDKVDFPFSTFTQVFLIIILFGIGTDYNILLYTRFKEELGKQNHVLKAIKETYKTAGRTVIYSGVAVFIGFVALYLAQFKLYQATSGVAVGVAVLLLVLVTLNPFFMAVLGIKMFWPIKSVEGHAENKLWHGLAKFSFFRPMIALLIVAIICIPFIWNSSNELNYDDLVEINDRYESKQGIKVIENHFPPGFSSPANLVIQGHESLATQQALHDIDKLADAIVKIDGVSEVYSVTRPTGERIEELYIEEQTGELNSGLDDAKEGLSTINEGLSAAESELGTADESGVENVQQLIDGTEKMKQGVSAVGGALDEVQEGFESGAVGANELTTSVGVLKDSVAQLSQGAQQLQTGYSQLANGFSQFSELFTTMNTAIGSATEGYKQIEQSMTALTTSNPSLANDVNVQKVIGTAQAAEQQLAQLQQQLVTLTPQYNETVQAFNEANLSFKEITAGLDQLETGAGQLQTGLGTLASGLQSGANGVGQITTKTGDLATGLEQVQNGQKQLQSGLTELQGQMKVLQQGLADSTEGLTEINKGLTEAQDYLGGLSNTPAGNFYIPQEVLEGEEFEESLNLYMSENHEMTKMMIILDVNPYSKEAMDIMKDIDAQVKASVKSLSFRDAQVAIGGKTMENVDLQTISAEDFSRTILIMMVGIALVLLVITRSIWLSLLIIGSLILTYYTSLGLTEIISSVVLGQNLLSWNVPFFSFIMIVALGVDYSIFLMMRYREGEETSNVKIIEAAKHIGGVVLSAALILGGTFAALLPSGILTLMQVAIFVIVGLVLLSLLMLPILMPAVMGLTEKVTNLVKKK